MVYTIIEIIYFLLVAAILGSILGWLLHARLVDDAIEKAKLEQRISDEQELTTLRADLEKCKLRCQEFEEASNGKVT